MPFAYVQLLAGCISSYFRSFLSMYICLQDPFPAISKDLNFKIFPGERAPGIPLDDSPSPPPYVMNVCLAVALCGNGFDGGGGGGNYSLLNLENCASL